MAIDWYPPIQISFTIFLVILSIAGIIYSKSKYRARNDFSKRDKWIVRHKKQKNRCNKCKKTLRWSKFQYHHKDGNRGNNRISNCEVLCTKCHKDVTSRNYASYRNRTNWISLKWSLLSAILLLIIVLLSPHPK